MARRNESGTRETAHDALEEVGGYRARRGVLKHKRWREGDTADYT